jgi:Fic family protein
MERNESLMRYLESHDQISIVDYMHLMNLPYQTASRSLDALVEEGVLVRDEIGGRAWYALASGE